MSLHELSTWNGPVRDEHADFQVVESVTRYRGHVWDVQTDLVTIGGQTVERDFVAHTGAVAVIALDCEDRVYLLRQYRHPVGMYLFEPPAGLIDVEGEVPLLTAKRELAEEAGLEAETWHVLIDYFTTPGGSSETIRIYLARDLLLLEGGRIQTGEAEEADLPGQWVPLDDAVSLILSAQIGNPTAVVGVLAAAQAKQADWRTLRAADAPWPTREYLLAHGRVRTDVAPRH